MYKRQINPIGEDVVFDIGRISEIAGNADQYFDVMDGKTKQLPEKIKIEPMGFRLIEFKLEINAKLFFAFFYGTHTILFR